MHYLVEASTIDEMLLELEERLEDLEDQVLLADRRAPILSKVYKCHGMFRILREEIRAQIHDPEVGHPTALSQEGSDRT